MATLRPVLQTQTAAALALLDVVASDVFEAPGAGAQKLAVVDCILTLLCTDGDPHGRVAPRDPVTLTPVIEHLTSRAAAECRERVPELEADFFNTANLAVDVAEAEGLSSLRARKARLGVGYFAPGMLRAIVTYNMALQQSRQPWVCEVSEEDGEAFGAPAASGSVFGSPGLRALHDAMKRHLGREADPRGAAGRIVRALPLDELEPAEKAALRAGSLASSDLAGAILLVGLLSRTGETLSIDLQEIGVDPDLIAGPWTEELDQLVRLEVNEAIMGSQAGSAYASAQKLSALRDRWLYASVQSARREARENEPPRRPVAPVGTDREERAVRAEARRLAGEAVVGAGATGLRPPALRDARALPWRLVAPAAAALVLAVALGLHALGFVDLLGRDLDRWSRKELAAVSEHLVRGHRSGDGEGPAFVGIVGDSWLELTPATREATGRAIVAELRNRGIAQVMIYDESRQLRIQGLGRTIQSL